MPPMKRTLEKFSERGKLDAENPLPYRPFIFSARPSGRRGASLIGAAAFIFAAPS